MQNGHGSHPHLINGLSHPTSGPGKGSKTPRATVRPSNSFKNITIISNADSSSSSDINNNDDNNDRDNLRSSSSSEEDNHDVVKACKLLQRQRSSANTHQNGLYDYRFIVHSMHDLSSRKRKLILHVDIRNTILVADSITNVSVEEALNSFLTSVVWGRELDGRWRWYSDVPSLKAPAPGLKTYYKYLEKKLVRTRDDRAKLRLKTGDFVHTSKGQQFLKHFDVHLARLAWEHSQEPMNKVLTMSGKDGRPYHYILPSFYKLLQYLTQKKRDFAIVLRTYGLDADNVLSSLQFGIQGNHPAYQTPLNLPVHKKPGVISRTDQGFVLRTFKSENDSETFQLVTHDRDIYRHFCQAKGLSGFVDDFYAWQSHDYHHSCGKPFWIDTSDIRHQHIFFDDNFRFDDEDSIINVRLFSKDNPGVAHSLSHSDVQRFENSCLVQADLLESIADESYFIRMVRMCEDNYSRLLKEDAL